MLPGDGAHRTSATLWLVEGDHPLRAIRYDDGFAGTDWSEIAQRAFGVSTDDKGRGESASNGDSEKIGS
jgi:hypothetical protein